MIGICTINGLPHRVERAQRRFRQDGYIVQRLHADETAGYPYWVQARQVRDLVRG